MVKILIKKFDKNIKLPTYRTSGSSGMDLMAYVKNKIAIELRYKHSIRKELNFSSKELRLFEKMYMWISKKLFS